MSKMKEWCQNRMEEGFTYEQAVALWENYNGKRVSVPAYSEHDDESGSADSSKARRRLLRQKRLRSRVRGRTKDDYWEE